MQHPPFPLLPPAGIAASHYVSVACALDADACHSRLRTHLSTLWNKSKFKDTPLTHSVSNALFAPEDRRDRDVEQLRRQGELLLCWHGTQATTVSRFAEAAA